MRAGLAAGDRGVRGVLEPVALGHPVEQRALEVGDVAGHALDARVLERLDDDVVADPVDADPPHLLGGERAWRAEGERRQGEGGAWARAFRGGAATGPGRPPGGRRPAARKVTPRRSPRSRRRSSACRRRASLGRHLGVRLHRRPAGVARRACRATGPRRRPPPRLLALHRHREGRDLAVRHVVAPSLDAAERAVAPPHSEPRRAAAGRSGRDASRAGGVPRSPRAAPTFARASGEPPWPRSIPPRATSSSSTPSTWTPSVRRAARAARARHRRDHEPARRLRLGQPAERGPDAGRQRRPVARPRGFEAMREDTDAGRAHDRGGGLCPPSTRLELRQQRGAATA